jgi:hypothetical protein
VSTNPIVSVYLRIGIITFLALGSGALAAGATATSLVIRVQDPANLPLAGAKVNVTAMNGPWRASASTIDDGSVHFSSLPSGVYRVQVEAAGFAPWDYQALVSPATVTQVTVVLSLEALREAVVVTEVLSGPAASTPNRVIEHAETAALPLNRRNVLDFAMLSAPANRDSLQVLAVAATSGISVAGNRPRANSLSLDGMPMNDEVSGAFRSQLPVEAIQEVQVQAGEFDIDQGRRLGGDIEITTRSGSNDLHGSAFGYFRHRSLDATNALSPVRDPGDTRAQFGASLGGALRQNQTFFFLAMEGLREQTVAFHRIGQGRDLFALSPQQQQLAGDPVMAPYLQLARRGAEIARTGVDPLGQALNYRIAALGDLSNSTPRHLRGDSYSARLDYLLRARHRLMVHASYGTNEDSAIETQNDDQTRGLSSPDRLSRMHIIDPTVTLGLTSTWSTDWTQDLRAGWARRNFGILPVANATGVNLSGVAFLGREPFGPIRRTERQWHVSDTVSWNRGGTLVRFGGDLVYAPLEMDFARRSQGLFVFGERPAPQFPAAPPLTVVQAYGLGLPAQFVQEIGLTRAATGKTSLGAFGAVRRQFTPRWSAELGIRYDRESPHGDPLNLPSQLQSAYTALGVVQVPRTDGNNWQPRAGLAYRVREDGRLILRLAYSIYADRLITHPLWAARVQNGATVVQTTLVGPAAIQVFQSPLQQLSASVPGGPPSGLLTYDSNWRIGYSQNVSAAVEAQLSQRSKLMLRYLGTRGTALGRARDRNAPDSVRAAAFLASGHTTAELLAQNYFRLLPDAAEVMTIEGAARSAYHALMIEYQARWSRLWWSGSYTWSKAIDDADDIFPLTRAQDQSNFHAERGLSLFDQRHRAVNSLNWQFGDAGKGWKQLFAHWNASAIVEIASGRPYTVLLGYDNNLDQFPSSDRPDVLLRSGSVQYAAPLQGRSGNLGRNTNLGPAFASTSLRITRVLPVAERVNLSFSAEGFNVFNRTNVRSVNTNFRNAGQPLTAYDPRQIQLGLRLQF